MTEKVKNQVSKLNTDVCLIPGGLTTYCLQQTYPGISPSRLLTERMDGTMEKAVHSS